MKKNINIKNSLIALSVAILFSIIPTSASAATVYLESSRNTMSVGDTAIITVKVNADGAVLNTIEGDIAIKSPSLDLIVQEFSLGNSAFGLWPRTPSLSDDAKTISFVGGVPGGFSIEGATLFKIIVEAKKVGTVTLSPQKISAFMNDGKGTKVSANVKDLVINITAKKAGTVVNNEWSTLVATDKIAPEDFIVVAGQDPTLFDGKKFVYFSALDNQSGIDHYDVSENGAPVVISGSTYTPQDQSNNLKLTVTAYDKAGNKKIALYPSELNNRPIAWGSVIVIVLILTVITMIIKVIIRRRKISKNNINVTETIQK